MKEFILILALVIIAQSCAHKDTHDTSTEETKVDSSTSTENKLPDQGTPTDAGKLSQESSYVFAFDQDAEDVDNNYDMFFLGDVDNLKPYRAKLKGKLISYISVGSWEAYRKDEKLLKPFCLRKYSGYPDECHLDLSKWRSYVDVMLRRIDAVKSKGYDGVYFDNAGMFDDELGTYKDNVEYLKVLSEYTKFHGLLVGFNNAPDMSKELINTIDFQVLESCNDAKNCDKYKPVVEAKKPVFHIEFKDKNCYAVSGHKVSLYKKLSNPIKHCDKISK